MCTSMQVHVCTSIWWRKCELPTHMAQVPYYTQLNPVHPSGLNQKCQPMCVIAPILFTPSSNSPLGSEGKVGQVTVCCRSPHRRSREGCSSMEAAVMLLGCDVPVELPATGL